jgi:hypothetical protein
MAAEGPGPDDPIDEGMTTNGYAVWGGGGCAATGVSAAPDSASATIASPDAAVVIPNRAATLASNRELGVVPVSPCLTQLILDKSTDRNRPEQWPSVGVLPLWIAASVRPDKWPTRRPPDRSQARIRAPESIPDCEQTSDYRSPYGPRRCLSDPGRERHVARSLVDGNRPETPGRACDRDHPQPAL